MSIAGALQAEWMGRVKLLIYSCVGMPISMTLVTACSATYAKNGSAGVGTAVIVFLFTFFCSYDIGLTSIPSLYVGEIAPTSLRLKYLSLYWVSCTCALCFNQYVNPVAFDEIQWKYYLAYVGILLVVALILSFFAPETKGLTLEEIVTRLDKRIAEGMEQTADRLKAEKRVHLDVASPVQTDAV